ncbi:phospholipid-binding protein [Myxosarcina sp. GI1(2024)]
MKIKFNSGKILPIFFIITLAITFSACKDPRDRSALLVKNSSSSIPIERTGLDGEYDPNGLAKRVAKAFEKDFILKGISTVYVAQNNSKIILKGKVSNETFYNRLVTVARNVRGVSEVDISQVEIRTLPW